MKHPERSRRALSSLLSLLAHLPVMLTQDNNLCSPYILVVLLGLAADRGQGGNEGLLSPRQCRVF